MQRSPWTIFSSALLLTFCVSHLSVSAQDATGSKENLAQELALSVRALRTQTKDLSPEERIAAVDQWLKTHSPQREAERQQRIEASKSELALQPIATPSQTQEVSELDQIDATIMGEIQSVRVTDLSPEAHILRMEQVIQTTSNLRKQRKEALEEESAGNTTPPQSTTNQPAPLTRTDILAAKSTEIQEQVKNLSAEERIRIIDSRKAELEAFLSEMKAANSDQSAQPNE